MRIGFDDVRLGVIGSPAQKPDGTSFSIRPRDYFTQQWLPEQQAPPPQQSAVREVALAVPIMARAVMMIKRYFIVPPVE